MVDFNFDITRDELTPYFKRQFKGMQRGVTKPMVKAAEEVAFDWWRRAGTGEKGAPVKTGNLRGSLSGGAQGVNVVTGAPERTTASGDNKGRARPNREHRRNQHGEILIEVGANAEYAAAVHELVSPGGDKIARITGRGKYIEFNLRENMKKWLRHIAKSAGRSLKS